MQWCSALAVLALLASAIAQDGLVGTGPEAAAALDSDGECMAEYRVAAGGGCALSALQLRANKQQQQEQEKEEEDERQQQQQAQQSGEQEEKDQEEETEEPRAERLAPRNASLLEEMYSTSAKCFSYTGGSCISEHCAPYRHAQCHLGKCICQDGCAGADGKCYSQQNRLVAKGVLLRNGKYKHYKMYFQRMSTFGQMKTTRASSWMNMAQDKFDIYEVPGSDSGHKEYFLASSKWSDYVLGMKATTGTALSPFAAYAVNLDKKGGVLDTWGPTNIMLRVCETATGMVQVGAKMADANTIWAYVHHGSWYVYGSVSTPGWGGEWTLEPAVAKGTFPLCGR
mmetsp:Transcript_95648/g.241061  ORF Transcript_95648/g.241061 Transcript_95648/m.241061 type:complete len:340 (-) Transcript_95648:169-1188(-)